MKKARSKKWKGKRKRRKIKESPDFLFCAKENVILVSNRELEYNQKV